MSDASIMQTLVLNQPLAFTTSTGIDRVKVHNDSGFYLRVYFGLGAPSSATGSGWHGTVSPGASPVLPVVGASTSTEGLDLTNSRTTGVYQGQVIVLPFLPAGAAVSSGGVITGASLCFLTSYYPGEYAEPGGQIDAYVQGAKQGRLQVVGGGIQRMFISADQSAASWNGSLTVAGAFPWTFFQPDMPNLFLANAAGPSWVVFYFYGANIQFQTGAALASLNFHLQVQITSAGGGVVRNQRGFALYKLSLPAANNQIVFDDRPSHPTITALLLSQNVLTSGDELRILFVRDGTFNNWVAVCQVDFAIDIVNQSPLMDIPSSLISTGAGLNYNSVYNPQTY